MCPSRQKQFFWFTSRGWGEFNWCSWRLVLSFFLTARNRVLLEKLTGSHLVKQFPTFYGTRLKEPVTCPYHEPDQSSPCPPPYFLKIHLNIIFPLTPGRIFLRFPHQNPVCTSPVPHTWYLPRPFHSPRIDHPKNIWRAVQIIGAYLDVKILSSEHMISLQNKTCL